MYPCCRRRDIRSIGFWSYPVGRPSETSTKKWVQRCNFTLKVVARLKDAETGLSRGWLVKVRNQAEKDCLMSVSAEQAAGHKMRQHFMRNVEGAVCRMTSDDFLSFVDEDKCDSVVYISRHVGKICANGSVVWHFPSLQLGDMRVFFDENELRTGGVVLPTLPRPKMADTHERGAQRLKRLGRAMRAVYGRDRFSRALHLCTAAMKAIHFEALMNTYHFVPVTNISGPANCGKTLGSAIALSLLECSSLMMSRCTPSAMIDAADTFKSLAIVWDDPRDCSHSMSSIVHEAFNGLPTTLVTRGVRKYNSLIIIGTQERNLGMPQTSVNSATFSRLSHIDMLVEDAEPFSYEKEGELQEALKDLGGMLSHMIAVTPFQPEKISQLQIKYTQNNSHVIGRSIQIAAIDSYYASHLAKLMGVEEEDGVESYFDTEYMAYLNMYCGKSDAVERFCADLKSIMLRRSDIPSTAFKEKVTVDLKHYGPTECFAVYTKELLPYMQKHLTISYTKEQLHGAVKSVQTYGEVSRNVSYRVGASSVVRRSLVIRQTFIM